MVSFVDQIGRQVQSVCSLLRLLSISIDLLRIQDLEEAYIFYPRSSLARKNLEHFLLHRHVRHQVCDLYETVFQKPQPVPDLANIDEIIFTSPTTVRGFVEAFGSLPKDKNLTCIGPITETALQKYFV